MFQAIAGTGTETTSRKLPPVVERIERQTPESPSPICVLVVGMAGSGKTTLMAQLQQSTIAVEEEGEEQGGEEEEQACDEKTAATSHDTSKMPAYCINLDPATLDVPYSPSIDIRDTVDYKVRSNKSCRQWWDPDGSFETNS